MRHISSQMTLSISGASTYPYALPAAGKKILLTHAGVNYLNSVKPAAHDNWSWQYACLQTYGGGCFCPDFSAAGAFVMAGQGGHNASSIYGAAIFDFQTGVWSYRPNANGFPERQGDVHVNETTGYPDYELTGYGNMPAPAHQYNFALGLPKARTGGNKGQMIRLLGAALAGDAVADSFRAHAINLETGLWTRRSTNNARVAFGIGEPATDSHAAYDPTGNRIYSSILSSDTLLYLDCADWAFKRVACTTGNISDFFFGYCSIFIDDARRMLVAASINPVDWGGTGILKFFAVDLTNIGIGWRRLSVTDTTGVSVSSLTHAWHKYPTADGGDGAFYSFRGRTNSTNTDAAVDPALPLTHPKASMQQLWKLAPPASSPFTNAWTLSLTPTITSGDNSGGINGEWVQDFGSGAQHMTRFIYVPALRCFAWFPRGDSKVELIKP